MLLHWNVEIERIKTNPTCFKHVENELIETVFIFENGPMIWLHVDRGVLEKFEMLIKTSSQYSQKIGFVQ